MVREQVIPYSIEREGGWRAFYVAGQLSFDMVGVIADITYTLAKAQVSVFVISTYDTDYFLVKCDRLNIAIEVLTAAGHVVMQDT